LPLLRNSPGKLRGSQRFRQQEKKLNHQYVAASKLPRFKPLVTFSFGHSIPNATETVILLFSFSGSCREKQDNKPQLPRIIF